MDITFWLTSTTRVMTKDNWGLAPMGGAEISAVNLGAELLEKGHNVKYYLQRCEPFKKGGLSVDLHTNIAGEHEYFVCVRPHNILLPTSPLQAEKKVLWSGDAFDQPSNTIFDDENTAGSMDALVFKSEWQKRKMLERFFYLDSSKVSVIYNGVNTAFFKDLRQTFQKNRFIYASTWYRGLNNFVEIWPEIRKAIPDAEIHIFAQTGLYFDGNPSNTGYYPIAEQLCKQPGTILRHPVPQWVLAIELRKANLMLYPNTRFVESSCGVALQSLAAGTPVVTTRRAALPETVGENGVLVDEGEGWQDRFVEGVVKLWENPKLRNQMGNSGRRRVMKQSWTQQAKLWEDHLKSL